MPKSAESLSGVKILIVEDEILIAEEIRERLSRLGANVVDVIDEGHAVEPAASRLQPDLILMDIRLKGVMTGIEAADLINRTLQIPVVFLTAHSDWETVQRAKRSDPFGYVLKPFTEAELVATLEIALHRHTLQRQLLENERKYEAMLASIGEGVIAIDPEGRVTFMNPAAQTLTRWRMADALGHAIDEVLPLAAMAEGDPGQSPALEALRLRRVVRPREPVLLITPDGEKIPIDISAAPNIVPGEKAGVPGAVVTFRDVTERDRMEDALRRSEARYRAVVDEQTEFIVRWLPDGTRTFVNEAYARYFGQARADLIGSSFYPLIQTDEEREAVRHAIASLTPANPIMVNEHHGLRADGQWRWQEWVDRGLFDDQGNLVELQSVGRDVHERFIAEQQLRDSQRLLEQAQQIGRIGSWTRTPGPVGALDWSKEMCRIAGIVPSEFDGQRETSLRFVHPEDRELVARAQQATWLGEHPYDLEYRIVRGDGQTRWVHEQTEVERDEAGYPLRMVGVMQDLTERRQLETQLLHSRKLESLGVLAAGVAHDFNNLLTVINGYSEMLIMRGTLDVASRKLLDQILAAGDRASRLTRQLLAFSRKQVLQPVVVDLGTMVSDIGRMLERLLGEDVTLTTMSEPGLWPVRVDPGQIEQVIVNLAANARDAMPFGGQLKIETGNVEVIEGAFRAIRELEPGRYVRLTVSDTGAGMDQATQERVFEPFFTTKEMGRGTGLGLATVYGIVRQSGGVIRLQSEIGKGTSFRIYFPAIPAPVTAMPDTDDRSMSRGSETILLVEDDANVRSLLSTALHTCGYTVYEADSGREAVRLFIEHASEIPLVVTDVVMPGMSGREVAEALREAKPTVRILFLSGYTDDTVLRHGVVHGDVAFLQKPCTMAALTNKIREVLDQ